MRRRLRVLPALSMLSACAELVSFPEDPVLIEPGPWDCRGAPAAAAPPPAPTVTLRVRACDSFGDCSAPAAELSAKLCEKLDVGCSRPLQRDLRPLDGLFELQVPVGDSGFDGYLSVSSPPQLCTDPALGELGPALCALAPECDAEAPDERCLVPLYAPALFFFNPPLRSEPAAPFSLSLLPLPAVPALARAAGASFEPELGNLVVTGFDCAGARAAGVSYELRQHAGQVNPLYMANGILSDSLYQTDTTGIGAFVSVPPGFVDVLAHDGDGDVIGGVGVQVSKLAISYATLVPAPGVEVAGGL